MPLAVKPLLHSEDTDHDDKVLTTEDRLTQFVRAEIDRALRDVDRRKRLAEKDLELQARRVSNRIVSSGHRLERSLRRTSRPALPLTIGLAIIGAALFLSRRP
jgi:hypothetical protein